MLKDLPGEPYAKGQFIVWFVKDKEDAGKIKQICDNVGVILVDHFPERGLVTFDEEKADEVKEKLLSYPEYIRNVSRNNYLYLQ